jgi:glyoxylase-like metal-dependent hydrolase (beta-lactamase superfamily II)
VTGAGKISRALPVQDCGLDESEPERMLRYLTIPVTPFAQNSSIVWCDDTMTGAVIDPGGEIERIRAAAGRLGVKLEQILLTHAHIDHAGGAGTLARESQLPIIGPHPGDQFWIDALEEQSRMFGMPRAETFTPTRWLVDGDSVRVGDVALAVRHCPGHTPGHVVFHDADAKRAFVGDVLFAGSIGRTDFPGGDYDTLIASIVERLWPMGDDTVFIPGHGPESTFGRERRSNPFVGGT